MRRKALKGNLITPLIFHFFNLVQLLARPFLRVIPCVPDCYPAYTACITTHKHLHINVNVRRRVDQNYFSRVAPTSLFRHAHSKVHVPRPEYSTYYHTYVHVVVRTRRDKRTGRSYAATEEAC